MFEILFLGTSASAPSIYRGLSAQIVKHNEHRFLIDCGEGTQRQILRSGTGFRKLTKILITHGHLDHILGLAGLLSTFMRWEVVEEIDIYGGKRALERIHDLLFGVVLRGAKTAVKINLIPIQAGKIFAANDFTVEAFPVVHRGPDSFGYIFQGKTHKPFLVNKAEQLGVPHGPIRKELVNGKTVTLMDGSVITPDKVLGKAKPGIKLVHVGDTEYSDGIIQNANNADALVIEATYLDADREMAETYAHLTAKQAAELALEANVQQLILTHISRRYRERDVLNEASQIFPNTVVARDLDQFQIRKQDFQKIND